MLEVEPDIGGVGLSDPHRGLTDGREAAASCWPAVAGRRSRGDSGCKMQTPASRDRGIYVNIWDPD